MALTDTALVAQVIALNSERAFALLVNRHQEPVRRFLLRLTAGDTMRADDIAQETFIRAWQGLHSFRQLAGFRTWLLSIAYRAFLDDQRQAARAPSDVRVYSRAPSDVSVSVGFPDGSPSTHSHTTYPYSQPPPNALSPSTTTHSHSTYPSPPATNTWQQAELTPDPRPTPDDTFALHHDIDLALATLSEAERTCVILQCIEGRSISDISEITHIPQNTVKSHLLRGKKALANYLRRNGYT